MEAKRDLLRDRALERAGLLKDLKRPDCLDPDLWNGKIFKMTNDQLVAWQFVRELRLSQMNEAILGIGGQSPKGAGLSARQLPDEVPGIYVFSSVTEDGDLEPLYIGMSENLRRRIMNHEIPRMLSIHHRDDLISLSVAPTPPFLKTIDFESAAIAKWWPKLNRSHILPHAERIERYIIRHHRELTPAQEQIVENHETLEELLERWNIPRKQSPTRE